MTRRFRILLATVACLTAASASAAGITGAGSGSTGGTLGSSTEDGSGLKTGADNGDEAVPSKQDHMGTGTGDNAVLNAPRETVPGTKAGSQPSNLSGSNPVP